ncbi:MAG: CHC2 zinc finger domain-containing protein [Steroidobacter sp.]
MARIPAEELERLKQTISLDRLAEARGIELKRHGADLIGRCPFHDDKTPSLVISPAKNLWHCLGACQSGGTVVDWVMRAEGVSFRHAVELLRSDAAFTAGKPVRQSSVPKLPPPVAFDADDRALLLQVIDYYHQTLLQSPEALDYLKKRGIVSEEAIRHFKLGYANRTLGLRLPEKNRIAGSEIRTRLQKLGLLRASGHEHFNGSIVIPVLDEHGQVSEVYGRKIRDDLREGTAYHLYLPGPHRGVWNGAALGASKEIILCEALIDALTFWCAGYRNVTASYGVEGFTADHLALFKQCGVERILIAYDRDDAGERAAEKLSKQLMAEGLDYYRILFPKGMDANEYAMKVQPAEKSLGLAIRKAQWLGKGAAKPITTTAAAPCTVPASSDEVRDADVATPSLAAEAEDLSPSATPFVAPVLDAVPAQVIPDAPSVLPAAECKTVGNEREHVLTFGERRYRIRGLEKNLSLETLKVNLLVTHLGSNLVHVDTFDLYSARQRGSFASQAATELHLQEDVIKADLGRLLLQCETLQEEALRAALAPTPTAVTVNEAERTAALELLRSPDLIERIAADFSRAGIVGEKTNALVGYLAAVSRKLDRPLALLIQSTSAAGKSLLMDAVLSFVPAEERIVYSAMTGQSLFYMGEMDLKHKILAIAEEAGAQRASYALKLLQSEGELTIASTSKDPDTGRLVTDEYRVEGPVMIFSTTTAADLDEELKNRCLVLAVDESREQTQAIHQAQRERRTLTGLKARAERARLLQLHQNAQRLIEPLAVMNPYADRLTFINDRTRTRRDHEKYLTLIDVIALLHQHQRELRTAEHSGEPLHYIEVTLEDIAIANRLAHEVLGRTLDELPPQTRRLLQLIVTMVESECAKLEIKRADYRFSRRQVREHTRWGDTQLKIHLARLTELEYLLVHRGGRGQSFEYELLYDGASDDMRHLSGLIDVEVLRTARGYDGERSGVKAERSGSGRPLVGARSAGGRGEVSHENTGETSAASDSSQADSKARILPAKTGIASYPHPLAAVAER